jgi:hypothetical protein
MKNRPSLRTVSDALHGYGRLPGIDNASVIAADGCSGRYGRGVRQPVVQREIVAARRSRVSRCGECVCLEIVATNAA